MYKKKTRNKELNNFSKTEEIACTTGQDIRRPWTSHGLHPSRDQAEPGLLSKSLCSERQQSAPAFRSTERSIPKFSDRRNHVLRPISVSYERAAAVTDLKFLQDPRLIEIAQSRGQQIENLNHKSLITIQREQALQKREVNPAEKAFFDPSPSISKEQAKQQLIERNLARGIEVGQPQRPKTVASTSPHLLVSKRKGLESVSTRVPLKIRLDIYRTDPAERAQLQARARKNEDYERQRKRSAILQQQENYVQLNIGKAVAGTHSRPAQSEDLKLRILEEIIRAELCKATREHQLNLDWERGARELEAKEEKTKAIETDILRRRRSEKSSAAQRVMLPICIAASRIALWSSELVRMRFVRAEKAEALRASYILFRCFRASLWRIRLTRAVHLRRFLRPRLWRAFLSVRIRRKRRHVMLIKEFLADVSSRMLLFSKMSEFRRKIINIQRFVKASMTIRRTQLHCLAKHWDRIRVFNRSLQISKSIVPRSNKRTARAAKSTLPQQQRLRSLSANGDSDDSDSSTSSQSSTSAVDMNVLTPEGHRVHHENHHKRFVASDLNFILIPESSNPHVKALLWKILSLRRSKYMAKVYRWQGFRQEWLEKKRFFDAEEQVRAMLQSVSLDMSATSDAADAEGEADPSSSKDEQTDPQPTLAEEKIPPLDEQGKGLEVKEEGSGSVVRLSSRASEGKDADVSHMNASQDEQAISQQHSTEEEGFHDDEINQEVENECGDRKEAIAASTDPELPAKSTAEISKTEDPHPEQKLHMAANPDTSAAPSPEKADAAPGGKRERWTYDHWVCLREPARFEDPRYRRHGPPRPVFHLLPKESDMFALFAAAVDSVHGKGQIQHMHIHDVALDAAK